MIIFKCLQVAYTSSSHCQVSIYPIIVALFIILYIIVLDAYYQFIGYDLVYCFVYISSASFPSSYFLL